MEEADRSAGGPPAASRSALRLSHITREALDWPWEGRQHMLQTATAQVGRRDLTSRGSAAAAALSRSWTSSSFFRSPPCPLEASGSRLSALPGICRLRVPAPARLPGSRASGPAGVLLTQSGRAAAPSRPPLGSGALLSPSCVSLRAHCCLGLLHVVPCTLRHTRPFAPGLPLRRGPSASFLRGAP